MFTNLLGEKTVRHLSELYYKVFLISVLVWDLTKNTIEKNKRFKPKKDKEREQTMRY